MISRNARRAAIGIAIVVSCALRDARAQYRPGELGNPPIPVEPVPTPEPSSEPGSEQIAVPTPGEAPAASEAETEPEPVRGYTFGLGIDVVSRFIWRGVSFGDQWTLQPTASVASHGFSTTLWASAAPNQASLVDYVGVTFSYVRGGAWGSLGVDVADWIFTQHYTTDAAGDPVVSTRSPYLFDFHGHGRGSHWLDETVYYTGPTSFPIKIQFGTILYNDPDFSKYVGFSYAVNVGRGFVLTPEFGFAIGLSRVWYLTDSDPINVTNCALTLRRDVDLGRGVTMPVSLATIVNPESGRIHLVGAIGVHL